MCGRGTQRQGEQGREAGALERPSPDAPGPRERRKRAALYAASHIWAAQIAGYWPDCVCTSSSCAAWRVSAAAASGADRVAAQRTHSLNCDKEASGRFKSKLPVSAEPAILRASKVVPNERSLPACQGTLQQQEKHSERTEGTERENCGSPECAFVHIAYIARWLSVFVRLRNGVAHGHSFRRVFVFVVELKFCFVCVVALRIQFLLALIRLADRRSEFTSALLCGTRAVDRHFSGHQIAFCFYNYWL